MGAGALEQLDAAHIQNIHNFQAKLKGQSCFLNPLQDHMILPRQYAFQLLNSAFLVS